MRFTAFASRNGKELLHDLFRIENFAPGIAVFSFSFISLFSGMFIAKDRSSSFLMRLFASPLSAFDYIVSYSLPLLLIALLQSAVCFAAAFFFGLPFSANVLLTMLVLMPVSLLFISFGLLLGSIFTDKQVGGVASILIQLAAFSGELSLIIPHLLWSVGYTVIIFVCAVMAFRKNMKS